MSPIWKPPPNREYPPTVDCKWCGGSLTNHCTRHLKNKDDVTYEVRNTHCSWYPCRKCQVVTYLSPPFKNDAGRWAWTKQYRKVAKSWFV